MKSDSSSSTGGLRSRFGAWCTRLMSKSAAATKPESRVPDARSRRSITSSSSTESESTRFLVPLPTARIAAADRRLATTCLSTAGHSNTQALARPPNRRLATTVLSPPTATTATATGSQPHARRTRPTAAARPRDSNDRLSLVASRRLQAAGLYDHKHKHCSMQQPPVPELSVARSPYVHLRQLQGHNQTKDKHTTTTAAAAAVAIASKRKRIRKAKLSASTHERLHLIGLNAHDSIPPWVPRAAVEIDRWSCELAVGSPTQSVSLERSVSAPPQMEMQMQQRRPSRSQDLQLRPPTEQSSHHVPRRQRRVSVQV